MSRTLAGLRLLAIGLFWLVAWIPLALYCLLSIALDLLRSRHLGQERVVQAADGHGLAQRHGATP